MNCAHASRQRFPGKPWTCVLCGVALDGPGSLSDAVLRHTEGAQRGEATGANVPPVAVAQVTPAAAAEFQTSGEAAVSPTSRGACIWCGPLRWQLEQTQAALRALKTAVESASYYDIRAALKAAGSVLE